MKPCAFLFNQTPGIATGKKETRRRNIRTLTNEGCGTRRYNVKTTDLKVGRYQGKTKSADSLPKLAGITTLTQLGRCAIKLSVFCGMSVDGFLARRDDTFDFLLEGEQIPHGFEAFLASVDVVVMGRRTFEVVRKLGHLATYGSKPMMVLSSRPLDFSSVTGVVVEQISGEPSEIVKQLTSRGFQHAYVDGGITIQRFLAAGLINRLVITRVPVLIGEGVPLFGPVPRDIRLRHVATRSYGGGMVQSEYEIDGQ